MEFVTKLGRAGTLYKPSAAYAPWQKGKVERKIESIKHVLRKAIIHCGVKADEMNIAGIEAAVAVNQRPGASGISPSMMLFGQRLKLYGEIDAGGEAVAHPEATDVSSELGRRMNIRNISRQSLEKYHAKEVLRKTVSARSRVVEHTAVGEIVFFYR